MPRLASIGPSVSGSPPPLTLEFRAFRTMVMKPNAESDERLIGSEHAPKRFRHDGDALLEVDRLGKFTFVVT